MQQEIVPVVLIIKLEKATNTSDIKFMLEGDNLIHDNGLEFRNFLRQAENAFR
jgi:hypothetical protein